VILSHTIPAPASSHQSSNSVFLSHYFSSSLQLQPAEHGGGWSWSGVRKKYCYLAGGWRLVLELCEREIL